MDELIENEDFYWEGGYMVFTAKYHLRRGNCCGSGCRHCPYEPRWTKGCAGIARETKTTQSTNQSIAADCQE